MKTCINPRCRRQLEDHQSQCPSCGQVQNAPVFNAAEEEAEEEEEVKRRAGFVTFWFVLAIIINTGSAAVSLFPKWAYGALFPDEAVPFSVMAGILSVVNIAAIIMLFCWKRWGFFMLVFSSVLAAVLTVCLGSVPYGLLSLVVWWLILQIRRDGVSCWDYLE